MGVLDFLAFKPTPLYRSMIADSGVPLPDLNSLRVNIIKGFAKTASLIGTALESENYQSLIGITGHLFSDRPLPITLASLNDPKLKSQFDDVAEQVRDKWFEASWDEANQVAYETTTHIPSTYTFNTIYENTIESLLPANVYSDSKSVIDRIDVMARDAIKRRVNFLSLIVDGMTRPETVDISRSSDLKPKEIGGWVVGIVEIIGVTLTSNDLSKDLVVGHAL